jgi:membrane protein DedA with SNARE-associated domain
LELLRDLADAFLAFADAHLYVALFVLLFIEEAGVPLPVPGDTLILLAGARASSGEGSPVIAALLVILATLFGSSILYWISRLGGMPVLLRISRFLRIREERVNRAGGWLRAHRGPAIVFGRLTPGLRTVTSAAAGTFSVNYAAFLGYTAISATLWATIYLTLGASIRSFYRTLGDWLWPPNPLALALAVFITVAAVVALRRRAWLSDARAALSRRGTKATSSKQDARVPRRLSR